MTRCLLACAALMMCAAAAYGQDGPARPAGLVPFSLDQEPRPAESRPWLADRGEGVHTSMFGNYIQKHEFVAYLFYEYTQNHDQEYKPEELGFVGSQDFNARRVDHELLLWVGYGITDDLIVEFESALWARSTQWKSSQDTSAMPGSISEQGLGDTEGQIRWRFLHETENGPEILARFEYVLPLQRGKLLIGTQGWEFEAGLVITKGFSWGTLSFSIGYAYSREEKKAELGEYLLEYVRKLSDQWRVVAALEGSQDEVSGILEFQWKPWPNITIKVNNGFGITSKAPDWAPEVGIMISF